MKLLPLLLAIFYVLPALAADIAPARTKINNKCNSYRMCDVEAGTGVCQDVPGTNEIVLHMGFRADYTFMSEASDASDYTCNIFTSGDGTPTVGANDQVNTNSITDEDPTYLMSVLLTYLWVNCSTIADNTVTIDAKVCPR